MADVPMAAVSAEVSRIEESAMYTAQIQFSSSKFWRGLHLVLGVPAVALAAVAGGTSLSRVTDPRTAGWLTLFAAALTAVMTTLNAAQRAEQSRIAANHYLALQGDARILRKIDLARLDAADARQRLTELRQRQTTINEHAPLAAFLTYVLGRRNIQRRRQVYEVDDPA